VERKKERITKDRQKDKYYLDLAVKQGTFCFRHLIGCFHFRLWIKEGDQLLKTLFINQGNWKVASNKEFHNFLIDLGRFFFIL
jgi:hypothetical protein